MKNYHQIMFSDFIHNIQLKGYLLIVTQILTLGAVAQSPYYLPDNFYDQKVGQDWDRPVGITFDENGTGYVWEKGGTVYLLSENGEKSSEPLIDISDEVGNWGDHGLLGFTLDPDFQENGYFYMLYVVDRHHLEAFGTDRYDRGKDIYKQATIGRVTRYTADLLTGFTSVVPDSRKVLIGKGYSDGIPVLLPSHGVGALVFGDDGTLLVSCGDGGSYESIDVGNAEETYYAQALEDGIIQPEENVGAFKSLQVNSLNGKILRIDPGTGMGVSSNPFFDTDSPNSPRSKVWALGFRNPFRFVHIPNTGEHFPEDGNPGTLIIGDVGSAGWEELNIVKEGGINFGWPMFEGTEYHWGFFHAYTPNPEAPNPLKASSGCGDFLNFQDIIMPDIARDTFFAIPCDPTVRIPSSVHTFIQRRPTITWSGKLWNPPARAKVTTFDAEGYPLEFQFDEKNAPIEAANFNGFTSLPGFFYEGESFPQKFQGLFFQADLSGWIRTFRFNEELRVTKIDSFALWDDKGVVHIAQNPKDGCLYWCHIYSSEVHKICYGGNPPPVALLAADKSYGTSPLEVQFTGDQSFDPDGSNISYFWEFGDGTTSTDPNPKHTFTASSDQPQSYSIQLTVTDTAGLSHTESIAVSLNNTPPQVAINNIQDSAYYSVTGHNYLPLSATVTDQEHSLSQLDYQWEVFFHHNDHYHPEAPIYEVETSTVIDPVGCKEELYWYRIKLTVTDANGLAGSDEKELFPYCGDPIVDLDPLQGEVVETAIQLNWTTLFEDQIEAFEIERTLDYQFETIGQVNARGSMVDYTFFDEAPLKGMNHYRIKAINAQGIYEYSNIVALDYPPKLSHYIAPNPIRDNYQIYIERTRSSAVEFNLYNSLGKLLKHYIWQVNPGAEFVQEMSAFDLPSGVYIYQLKDGDLEKIEELLIMN